MAENLRVKIDLSDAKLKSEAVTSIAPAPPEVVYHYNRILIALIITGWILYAAYHFIFSEHNNNSVPEPRLPAEQTLSVKPDSVARLQNNAQPDSDSHAEPSHKEILVHPSDPQPLADNKEPAVTDETILNKEKVPQQTTRPVQETETQATPPVDTRKAIEISTLVDKPIPSETDLTEASLPKDDKSTLATDRQEISQTAELLSKETEISEPVSPPVSSDKTILTDVGKSTTSPAASEDKGTRLQENSAVLTTAEFIASEKTSVAAAATVPVKIVSDKLSRVQLTSSVYKKEPVDQLPSVITGSEKKASKIYLFTQLDNSKGSTIEHQWWYNDKLILRKKFTASGDRWRCYSSKNIGKFRQGEWLIKVVDQNGELMAQAAFEFKI